MCPRSGRQGVVDAFPRLLHRLFLARRETPQRRPRQDGEVGARGVDADAPLRPFTPGNDVIAAIAAGFCVCHVRASWLGPPSLVQRCNGQTVSSLSGSLKIRTIGPVRNVWRLATPAPTSAAITSIGVTQPPAAHGRGHQGHGNLSLYPLPSEIRHFFGTTDREAAQVQRKRLWTMGIPTTPRMIQNEARRLVLVL